MGTAEWGLVVSAMAAVILLLAVRLWELRQDLEIERYNYNALRTASETRLKELKADNDVLMNFVGAIENMAQGTRNKVEAK